MKSYRPWSPSQSFLLPPSPLGWLPEGHLAYFVLDAVQTLDLSAIEEALQAKDGRGERPYSPAMMVALLVYGYSVGLFSSRRLARANDEDVARGAVQMARNWCASSMSTGAGSLAHPPLRAVGPIEQKEHLRVVPPAATGPNERWAMDFVHNRLVDGSRIHILAVIDTFTRECPVIAVEKSFSGKMVGTVLDELDAERGYPKTTTFDNGSEYCSRDESRGITAGASCSTALCRRARSRRPRERQSS